MMVVSVAKDIVEFDSGWNWINGQTVYGKIYCEPSYVYEWEFKILSKGKYSNIVIGIDSSMDHDKVLNEDFSDVEMVSRGGWMDAMQELTHYAYSNRGKKYTNEVDRAQDYGKVYGQNDRIRMVL